MNTKISFAILPLLALLAFAGQAQVYKYQDENGKWHFTDKPPADQKQNAVATTSAKAVRADLKEKLLERFKPGNKVDEATLAVVTVETNTGSGSGFFITDDGYLITNRHVVRPATTNQWKDAEGKLAEWKEKLEDYKVNIDDDEERLAEAKSEIDEYREYMQSGRATESQKTRYESYVKRYERNKERHDQNVARYRELERKYRKEKSNFGWSSSMSNFSRKFTIVLKNGDKLKARLIKISKDHDLALLKLDSYSTPHLSAAKRQYPKQGTKVFAIGSPFGISDALTTGIVTKAATDHMYTDTQILPGNSGGPLIDADGQVLGVNTALIARKGTTDGLGIVIYASRIRDEFGREIGGRF